MANTATALEVIPAHPCFGARVEGVDLADPLDDVTVARIFDAFQEHSVLVFPDQHLTDEQQMAFSRRFGPLETTITRSSTRAARSRRGCSTPSTRRSCRRCARRSSAPIR